jgi:hypothetical protein
MPRKFKSYVTQIGFFDLAVAAPSMKAALDAWGVTQNLFHQGFAQETDDPRLAAATMAKPGVVLKRAVGSTGEFKENAKLPNRLPDAPVRPERPKPQAANREAPPRNKVDRQANDAAILSFKKAKVQRDRKKARERAAREKEKTERRRKMDAAEAALDAARERHDKATRAIEKEREKVGRRADTEEERWRKEREKLEEAIRKAKR